MNTHHLNARLHFTLLDRSRAWAMLKHCFISLKRKTYILSTIFMDSISINNGHWLISKNIDTKPTDEKNILSWKHKRSFGRTLDTICLCLLFDKCRHSKFVFFLDQTDAIDSQTYATEATTELAPTTEESVAPTEPTESSVETESAEIEGWLCLNCENTFDKIFDTIFIKINWSILFYVKKGIFVFFKSRYDYATVKTTSNLTIVSKIIRIRLFVYSYSLIRLFVSRLFVCFRLFVSIRLFVSYRKLS